MSPSEAGLFAWGRKTCSDLCSRARCCKISALVQPSPAGSAACAQAPCIPSKACTLIPCVAGGKGGSPAARSLLLVALGGFRHFAGFSSRKIAVKGKGKGKARGFLLLRSAQGVKEVGEFTPRLSLCWCASISTSPSPVVTVSLRLSISKRSAKISPIPSSRLARCVCFQEKPEGLPPPSRFGGARGLPCQHSFGDDVDVSGIKAGARLSHGPGLSPSSQVLGQGCWSIPKSRAAEPLLPELEREKIQGEFPVKRGTAPLNVAVTNVPPEAFACWGCGKVSLGSTGTGIWVQVTPPSLQQCSSCPALPWVGWCWPS